MQMPEIKLTKTHYIIIAVLVLAFIVWRVVTVLMPKPAAGPEIPLVRTVTAGVTSTDDAYTYPGEVRGHYESNLAFQVAGKIVSRNVNLGDNVRAGQVLMTIDPKDVNQAVNANLAAVAAAQSNYKLASDNYNRFQTLFSEGAVSQMVRDQYKTQYEAAAATLQQAEAQLNASQNQLSYTQLVADHDGSVSAVSGEVGQVVAAGTPVVTLIQDGDREIQIFVPESRLGQIKPGQNAVITFWALDNVNAAGHVTEISPMADSVTKTYKVRVAVDNMPETAKLGMTAKVTLATGTESAIVVPTSAIYQTNDKPHVWVVRDKKATLVPVTVGGYEGSNVKVTSGINKGDIVVTGGVNKLSEGMEVRLESGDSK
jgi:multidrug efflux system membrane fusion protein